MLAASARRRPTDEALAARRRPVRRALELRFGRQTRAAPARYLYDALGFTLFDAICQLPWYGLTRAETRLLSSHAAEIVAALGPLARIVELGSGSGEKLATLLAEARRPAAPIHLHLIDVSPLALDVASRALSAFDGTLVISHQAPYEIGLEEVRRETSSDGGRSLMLFLGSNIGNFDPPSAEATRPRLPCHPVESP